VSAPMENRLGDRIEPGAKQIVEFADCPNRHSADQVPVAVLTAEPSLDGAELGSCAKKQGLGTRETRRLGPPFGGRCSFCGSL
jgi:hypothetical protein